MQEEEEGGGVKNAQQQRKACITVKFSRKMGFTKGQRQTRRWNQSVGEKKKGCHLNLQIDAHTDDAKEAEVTPTSVAQFIDSKENLPRAILHCANPLIILHTLNNERRKCSRQAFF